MTKPVGNWYEVERATAARVDGTVRRAGFSLDELPPSSSERATWLHWAELAREDLAAALDANPGAAGEADWLAAQDLALVAELGTPVEAPTVGAVDRLYAARDALMDALDRAPDGAVRRVLRLAIADDLRLAEQLRVR
jgi:hypothetical protein